MGYRANYAIRENGEITLYYSHWGGATVAEDIFWGPSRTESFIRSNKLSSEWLDDVWAEGGIALDKDNRSLTYYRSHWPDENEAAGAADAARCCPVTRLRKVMLEELQRRNFSEATTRGHIGVLWSVSRDFSASRPIGSVPARKLATP